MPTVELLSRLQFAFTIMFHYIFPPFSIGMGLLLVIFESLYVTTGLKVYETITRFWVKIFAANFSIGVASGIVMEFQFGTNWAAYSRFVGDIFGSPLAAEGIFAFFLESGFLAILLFGWNRVGKRTHLFATCMVALGSILSAFWIVVANSWQQTPVAYVLETHNGLTRAVITDFWAVVFNPSSMIRFTHTVVGAFIQGAFLVLSVSAYYLLKGRHTDFARRSMRVAVIVACIAVSIQPILGDIHAKEVAKYQPEKLAAFEGHYHTGPAAVYLFGYSDPKTQTTTGPHIPGMLSWLVTDSTTASIQGLDKTPQADWPAVNQVFQSYHTMVAIGVALLGLVWLSVILLLWKRFFAQRWLLWVFVFAVVLPVLANQLGWYSAERGRQPWVVWKLLRTSAAISKSVTGAEVLTSLILFGLLYGLLLVVWIYVLNREIQHGPKEYATAEVEAGYGQNKQFAEAIEEKIDSKS